MGRVYVYSDCIMNSNAPADQTHTHTQCASGWVGNFDKVNFTHRVNDE